MTFVSEESIDKALTIMDGLDEAQIESMFTEFSKKQPSILAFIMSNEDEMSEEEFNVLLELSVIIYLAFYQESPSLREVTETEMEEIIDKAIQAYEEMDEDDEAAISEAVENTVQSTGQPLLFQFIVEDLMAREEEGGFQDEESSPAFVLPTLQMLLDMFDTALNKPNLRIV